MSRARHSDDEEASLIDLTPMLDVVFLLLIFFMVSTRVFDPYGYEVELPETKTAPKLSGQSDTLVLIVQADGSAILNGRRLSNDEIPEIPAGSTVVTVRADRAASHGQVMTWMDRLQEAGVRSVTLASTPIENIVSP